MKATNQKKICLFVTLCLLIIAILNTTALSQFGEVADQRTQESVQLWDIGNLPPLNTDMSLDCMVSYIAMDSVGKTTDYDSVLYFIENTSLDTLKILSRYMYAVDEYNPLLMRSLISFMADSFPNSSSYKSLPQNCYYGTKGAILNKIQRFGRDYTMLVLTHFILRVRIDSVIIGLDSTYSDHIPWVNAACTVIDTIKGMYIPQNCTFEGPPIVKPGDKINTEENNCLIFGYPLNWRTGRLLRDGGLLNSETNISTVEKGEEYFVFLESLGLWHGADFITTSDYHEVCGGLFRINDGIVEDTGNFWGLGTTPSVQDFQNHLLTLISNIKAWWIQ